MSNLSTSRLKPEQRRALIVEAAGRLFGEHGYDGTRLDVVAAESGVTKPVLYRHFADKTALYLALLERHRDDLGRFEIPGEGTLEERLRAVGGQWLDYVETHTYAWQMLFRDRGGGPEVQAVRGEVHARARETLAAMIPGGREVEPLAELLSMGMASLVLWWMEEPAVERDAVLDAIVRVWRGVLEE